MSANARTLYDGRCRARVNVNEIFNLCASRTLCIAAHFFPVSPDKKLLTPNKLIIGSILQSNNLSISTIMPGLDEFTSLFCDERIKRCISHFCPASNRYPQDARDQYVETLMYDSIGGTSLIYQCQQARAEFVHRDLN